MKCRIVKVGCVFLGILFLGACAEKKNEVQDVEDIVVESDVSDEEEEKGIVLHSDVLTQNGTFEQTWSPDYDSSVWEDSPKLYIYVNITDSSEDSEIPEIEDACNAYLYSNGYDFQVHFITTSFEEFFNGVGTDQLVKNQQEEGIVIDLYVTGDYSTAVAEERVLELTDYLETTDGNQIYEHFDKMLWQQIRNEEGRIYGIPLNPVTANKRVYCYNPQLAEILDVNMQEFEGNIQNIEKYFSDMLQYPIAPIRLGLVLEDKLLLSEVGLETYGEIIAIRHAGDSWEAVDWWNEEELLSYYEYLGCLKEQGYLAYSPQLLEAMDLINTPVEDEMSSENYQYCFMSIDYIDYISWAMDVNMAQDGFVDTNYYIPDEQGYIYENENNDILVINNQTQYPEECMQFANLLVTDNELKMLLYKGIENYHYMWQDGKMLVDPTVVAFPVGLGFEYDRSFMCEESAKKYGAEICALNANVTYAASIENPCSFSEIMDIYEACKAIFDDNWLVFWGYYGDETNQKLEELHEELISAGYMQLIEYVNAER